MQPRTAVKPGEVAVQLFDPRHEVMVEPGNLNACRRQPELSSPADVIVGVEHTDDDPPDPPLDNTFDAGDLRATSNRARLQRREERRAGKCLVRELALQQRELGMLTCPELATERLAEKGAVSTDDCADSRRCAARFADRLPSQFHGALH